MTNMTWIRPRPSSFLYKLLLLALVLAEIHSFVPVIPRCYCTQGRHMSRWRQTVLLQEQNSKLRELDGLTPVTDASLLTDTFNDDETYAIAFRNTLLSVGVALLFGAGLWATAGPVVGAEYFAGYIVEKSLSVDNLFVFLLLFDYFQIPNQYQGRILSWGIYGSIVMRAIMIGLGAAALQKFRGILLVFAGILIYSAVQVLVDVEEELIEKENDLSGNIVVRFSKYLCESSETCNIDDFDDEELANPVVMLSRSLFPSTNVYDGDRFFTIEDGVKKATPLFVCMIAVELSDVVFAVDSIPAVFGVTENPLVVFSSNMFAILGLRSLYPVLARAATDLKYLESSIAVILAFIGGKMIAEYFEYVIPTEAALAVVVSLLGIGIGASIWDKRRAHERARND